MLDSAFNQITTRARTNPGRVCDLQATFIAGHLRLVSSLEQVGISHSSTVSLFVLTLRNSNCLFAVVIGHAVGTPVSPGR